MTINRIWIEVKNADRNTYDKISKILKVFPDEFDSDSVHNYNSWIYSVEKSDEDIYFDFVNKFLEILEPNFSALENLDIKKSDISFWHLYGYDQQCNMEFSPNNLKRLGENGITLCISCWEV